MRSYVATAMACVMLAGCASRASDIKADYVSALGYENLSCEQLAEEARAVSAHAAEATGEQNQKATRDAVAATVGVVVFWPALFLMRGDGATAGEVAHLRGEMDVIEKVSRWKKCQIRVEAGQTRQADAPH